MTSETCHGHFTMEYATNISSGREDIFTSKLSLEADYAIGAYLIVVAILASVLNILVIVTFVRRHRKCSPLELYIVSLALGDFFAGTFAHPFSSLAAFNHKWNLGISVCRAYAATVYFFGTCSISTLACMSVLRYIKTCHPSADQYLGKRTVYFSLVLIYLYSGFWAGSPLLGWGRYGTEPFGLTCTLDWLHLSVSYVACIFTFVYILPIICMFFSYGCMVHNICQAQRRMQNVNNRMDHYLTKMTIIMCAGFLLAWTPYAGVALCYVFNSTDSVPISLAVLAPMFAKSSTVYTPIIYFLAIKRFRKDVKEVICCCRVQDMEPDNTDFMEVGHINGDKSHTGTKSSRVKHYFEHDHTHDCDSRQERKGLIKAVVTPEIIPLKYFEEGFTQDAENMSLQHPWCGQVKEQDNANFIEMHNKECDSTENGT